MWAVATPCCYRYRIVGFCFSLMCYRNKIFEKFSENIFINVVFGVELIFTLQFGFGKSSNQCTFLFLLLLNNASKKKSWCSNTWRLFSWFLLEFSVAFCCFLVNLIMKSQVISVFFFKILMLFWLTWLCMSCQSSIT